MTDTSDESPLEPGSGVTPDDVFGKILAGEVPASFVYRDELCAAFMDIKAINPGHVLVIPRTPVRNLAELDEEAGAHLFRVGQRIAAAIRRSGIRCEGVNLFLADGEAAGQEVFHVHLHVIPRFRGDGFGLRFEKAAFQSRASLDETAGKIAAVLEKD